MSKKVVTFLVVLFAIAGVVILLAKQGQKPPAAETTQTQQETAVTPDTAKTEDKPEEKTEQSAQTEPAPAAESILGDEDPTKLSSGEPAREESREPAPEPAQPIILPNPSVEKKEPVIIDSGSLLSPSESTEVDMDNALAERAIGDPDAPVVVIEYASMTCPHCARFHNDVLATVKQKLIDTGKLRLIYRDYPLDTHALRAAMMARCTDRSRYFQLIEVIFKNQDRWVKSNDPLAGLKQLGALAGMDPSFIESCIKNPQLEQFILSGMQDGQRKYKIKATPTFIFNNDAEQLSGDQNPEDFERVVNELLKKKGQ